MTWEHLKAFLWLRRRLIINHWRRLGALNTAIMFVLAFLAIATAVPLFVGCFALGVYLIPRASPVHLMFAWDGLIVAFLLFWCIGLLTELQRNEPLSLSNFMHLPVTPNGAFLINYIGSLLSLSLVIFVPVMLGFALALIYVDGPRLLIAIPLVLSFLLMVTALTYQFQGWLASMMSNPRRRRAIVVTFTMVIVLVFQIPNLINLYRPFKPGPRFDHQKANDDLQRKFTALNEELAGEKVDFAERSRRMNKVVQEHNESVREAVRQADAAAMRAVMEQAERIAGVANIVLPVGWLPLGVRAAAEGNLLPAILGFAGLTAIGTFSLRRAYRTTVGYYQGRPTLTHAATPRTETPPRPRSSPAATSEHNPRPTLLEARLPLVSETVSALATASFRSLLRAPEARMLLLSPLITLVIFGSMIWNSRQSIPLTMRPFVGLGIMVITALGFTQLMGNQFGFDRDGFRVLVLCAARRRDILLGKNLAFVPLALGVALAQLTILQIICPMRFDHLLAMIPLYLVMYLFLCCLTNFMSIYTPIYLPQGSLKASNPKALTILAQVGVALIVFPLTQSLAFIPLGVEMLLRLIDATYGLPVALVLAVVELGLVLALFSLLLTWQGELFQSREQKILDVVTKRTG